MLFAGWEVGMVKNCDLSLAALGSIFKTEVTVFFVWTDPKLANNLLVFILSSLSQINFFKLNL